VLTNTMPLSSFAKPAAAALSAIVAQGRVPLSFASRPSVSRERGDTVVDLVNRLESEARASRQGGSPNISGAWTSSFSTNSATYPSLRPAASCSFI
jgi:hypothetical protein